MCLATHGGIKLIIEEMSVSCVSTTVEPERVLELAGRVCYKSESMMTEDSYKHFIKKIMRNGHHSVIEHSSATFQITCDRGVSHELVRHRLASFSQESTRYCNYSHDHFQKQITVIKPLALEDNTTEYGVWNDACLKAEEAYFSLLKLGYNPGVARAVLPISLKTEIVMTANFREWLHVLDLRLSQNAHPHIRKVMGLVLEDLVQLAPCVFSKMQQKFA